MNGDKLRSGGRTGRILLFAIIGGRQNYVINPMGRNIESRRRPERLAPLCGAKTRDSGRCQRPPVQGGKRCRLHGGLSPGAPRGAQNGNFTNGDWTLEAIAERKWLRSLIKSFAQSPRGK
jgi:hypothetical protein